jgi:glycosyltransferase Alg8
MGAQNRKLRTLPVTDDARFQPSFASPSCALIVAFAYAFTMIVTAAHLPREAFEPLSDVFILSIGLIGVWRYSWWLTHFVRSVIYRRFHFPRLRRAADAVARKGYKPGHVFVLSTSYRMAPQVTYAVYDAVIANALDYGVPTTVFASVSDRSDVDVLQQVMAARGHPSQVEMRYMFQRGDGKRSAMAEILRAIARIGVGPDDLVVFMDGDIRLPASTFRRSMPFFFLEDDLGALTTDNGALVDGGDFTREWYDLRYAQRHMLMSSTGLSRRVLVLTGRYSLVRADLCTSKDFIARVERDHIEHKRFGTVTFLSGDDKSTWFCLLEWGWAMRYVPDVKVFGFERLTNPDRFFSSTLDLMRRWFGNMFRTSGRAIRLGPRRMGLFTWWCLVDQRLSVWTTLVGPTVAIALTIFVRPSFGLAYLLWIMSTRLLASLLLGLGRGRFSPLWPLLLYYNQVAGAALKSHVSFHFDRQRWTRQNISGAQIRDPRIARRVLRESTAMHAAAVLLLVSAATFASGALQVPDFGIWARSLAAGGAHANDNRLRTAFHAPGRRDAALPRDEAQPVWHTLESQAPASASAASVLAGRTARAGMAAARFGASASARAGQDAALHCGSGPLACRLGDRVELEHMSLSPAARPTGGLQ